MPKAVRQVASANVDIVAEDLFTDREEPRKAFWEIYHGMEPGDYEVIVYYGVGGIGKTTLLKKLGREMDEQLPKGKLEHAFFSFEGHASKEEFLFSLSRQMMLCNKGLVFTLFDAAIIQIAAQEGKDISQFEEKVKNSFVNDPFVETAAKLGEIFIPGIGVVTSAAKAAEGLFNLRSKLKHTGEVAKGEFSQEYNEIKYLSSDELRRRLHEYFLKDVYDIFEKRQTPYVVFLDGYENLVSILGDGARSQIADAWISTEGSGLVNIPNVFWVIGGREKLNWSKAILPEEHMHRVGDLSKMDAAEFFRKAGVEESLYESLYELTNGTPAFMDICVKTYRTIHATRKPEPGDFGKNTSELANRYLRDMDKDEQALMIVFAWLPRVWDMEMADAVLKELHYDSLRLRVEELLKLSLFERVSSGYRLHDTFRDITRGFADPGVGEQVCSAVNHYLTDWLCTADDTSYRMDKIRQYCYNLKENGKTYRPSVDEIRLVVEQIREETKRSGDYWTCHELVGMLRTFVRDNKCDTESIVTCENAYNYNLYKLALKEELMECAVSTYNLACDELGEEHRESIRAKGCYVAALHSFKDYDRSVKLAEECYETSKRVLGDEDPVTLYMLNSLAVGYNACGDTKKAIELFQKCYEMRKRILGPEHPDTLLALDNLAFPYKDIGQIDKARELFEECFELRAHALGEAHPDTLRTLKNLIGVYEQLGDKDKVLELNEKYYEITVEALGPNHPTTLSAMASLAVIYHKSDNKEKAYDLFKECFERRKQLRGAEHKETLLTMNNLGIVSRDLGRLEEAEYLLKECLRLRKQINGTADADTIKTLHNLAFVYVKMGDTAGMDALYEEYYEKAVSEMGEDHPGTLTILMETGDFYVRQDNLSKAFLLYRECYKRRKRLLGPDHPDTYKVFRVLVYDIVPPGNKNREKKLWQDAQ